MKINNKKRKASNRGRRKITNFGFCTAFCEETGGLCQQDVYYRRPEYGIAVCKKHRHLVDWAINEEKNAK